MPRSPSSLESCGYSCVPLTRGVVTGSIIFPTLTFLVRDFFLRFDSTPEAYMEQLLKLEPEEPTGEGIEEPETGQTRVLPPPPWRHIPRILTAVQRF